jgi:hypothetical protein
VTGWPGMARSAGRAKRARRLLHSAPHAPEDEGREAPSWVVHFIAEKTELAHAQRPKFSGKRASRAALLCARIFLVAGR